RVISARGHDAGIINRSSVEPHSGRVHVRPSGPGIAGWVVDLRDGGKRWERCSTSEHVKFTLKYRAAGPCYWRRHHRAGRPGVARDIVDVQRVHLDAAVVTAGNVQLAVDNPEPRQEERLRQGRASTPGITGNVVDVERGYCATSIEAACHVDLPV